MGTKIRDTTEANPRESDLKLSLDNEIGKNEYTSIPFETTTRRILGNQVKIGAASAGCLGQINTQIYEKDKSQVCQEIYCSNKTFYREKKQIIIFLHKRKCDSGIIDVEGSYEYCCQERVQGYSQK